MTAKSSLKKTVRISVVYIIVEITALMCRIITITLTSPGILTSVQLADKNKTSCNSIQTPMFVEHPTYTQVWHIAFLIVGTRYRTIVHTCQQFQKCLEPHWNSPKKGRLRCQAIKLSLWKGLEPGEQLSEAQGAYVMWMPASRNPRQITSTNYYQNQDTPDLTHVLRNIAS